jgi:hypothetical protein
MGRDGYKRRYTLLLNPASKDDTPIDASAMLL